jgi:hypothetical protein
VESLLGGLGGGSTVHIVMSMASEDWRSVNVL